jgi:hypothetical protein
MSDINKIVLLELNKFGEMIQSGKISGSNITKARSLGMIKSPERYIRGLKKGTSEIIRKNKLNYISNSKVGNLGGGAATIPKIKEPANIHISKHSDTRKFFDPVSKEIMKRHEAIEGRESEKNRKKLGFHDHVLITKSNPEFEKAFGIKSSDPVGKHVNARPLQSDKHHTSFMHKAFGLAKTLHEYRKNSGEYDILKNKKLVKDINHPKQNLEYKNKHSNNIKGNEELNSRERVFDI